MKYCYKLDENITAKALTVILSIISLFLFDYQYSISNEANIDSLDLLVPNNIRYGLDKQLNIYAFNFFGNYNFTSDFGNFSINQKYLGTAYSAANTIVQDDEDFGIFYEYPTTDYISLLASTNYIHISNKGSSELNELSRGNFLAGGRVKPFNEIFLDFTAGVENNNQMGIISDATIYKISSGIESLEWEGYKFSGNLSSEFLFLNLDRINRTINVSGLFSKQYDYYNDYINANVNYRVLDRYNAFRRDNQYIEANELDFPFSLEARDNNLLITDVFMQFGLSDKLIGSLNLYFSQNSIQRQFKEYVPNDTRTGIRQSREQLRVSVKPEIRFEGDKYKQVFSIIYSFESDENKVTNINNIQGQEFQIYRNRATELDNITSIFRLISKSSLNLGRGDTLSLTALSSITRFDTPSEQNNSDRDEFLGLIGAAYTSRLSEISSFRIDAEIRLNHQVNLKASRSASNFWMRSIKFAPSVVIQTKSFFMRPQPYVLANYTVYDFEGFAPGLRSFSLRQIGYNDSIAIVFGNNLYLGTRIDLIYKETGTLFWKDFKEQPVNGNLKLFFKFYTGYFDKNFNIALGMRYFNLTQQTFRMSAFINSDYKTESYAPEVILSIDLLDKAVLRLNGWYEFQIINDTYKNEIPNIILNTSIKL